MAPLPRALPRSAPLHRTACSPPPPRYPLRSIKNLPNAFGSRSGRHHALRELSILRQTM